MSIKVLVADDSITIQKVIGIIFGGDDYSLTVVDNGKAAIDKAHEINPDILLIDVLMPGMTGYEVAESVRASSTLAAKPVLLLTGSFEPFDEEKAKKCGADGFIAKPFESQQIITKVKELIELGASRAAAAPQPAAPVAAPAPVVEEIPPSFEIQPPAFIPPAAAAVQPEPEQPAAPADIWGAFTQEEAPSPVAAAPQIQTQQVESFEPDVFAIVSEESNDRIIQAAEPEFTSPTHTGSQWVPVEENTFEFEEETVAQPPASVFTEQTPVIEEPSFGEIAFEDDPVTTVSNSSESSFASPEPAPVPPSYPAFTDPAPSFEAPSSIAQPFAPLADPAPAVTPVQLLQPVASPASSPLTEEQLKAALAGVSKDIIERIVWEVVPDLAEALIREAIRKIKEGV